MAITNQNVCRCVTFWAKNSGAKFYTFQGSDVQVWDFNLICESAPPLIKNFSSKSEPKFVKSTCDLQVLSHEVFQMNDRNEPLLL